ncbi:MAG: hypothetical protein ABSF77_05680 [Spirochaetia bacterium]|jgi:hypothetical protein
MDERTNVLVRTLKDRMDREAELFISLGQEVERLRDSFHKKIWGPSLAIAQGIEHSAIGIEDVDAARDDAFALLRDALDLPQETALSAVLPALSPEQRQELETSWRCLRMSIVRLKTATGRMRYSAEAMADTLNRILEHVFPYRKGKLYSRRGTPTSVGAAHLVDHNL